MTKLARKLADTGIGTILRSCILDVSHSPNEPYFTQVQDGYLSYVCISEAHVPWQYVFSYGSTTDASDYQGLVALVRYSSFEKAILRAKTA